MATPGAECTTGITLEIDSRSAQDRTLAKSGDIETLNRLIRDGSLPQPRRAPRSDFEGGIGTADSALLLSAIFSRLSSAPREPDSARRRAPEAI